MFGGVRNRLQNHLRNLDRPQPFGKEVFEALGLLWAHPPVRAMAEDYADAAVAQVAVPEVAAPEVPVTSLSFKTSSGNIDTAVQEVLQRQGTESKVAMDVPAGGKANGGKAKGRGRGGAGSSAGGRPAKAKLNCMLCDMPRKGGSFCAEHKKAYDVVYRAAFGPNSQERPSLDGEDSDVENEWDYELDMWKGSEQHSFIQISGNEFERKSCAWRQPSMAATILMDVVAMNGADGGQAGKRKVRKHAVVLGQYLHAEGFRQSSDHIDGVRKVDEEFYTHF